MRPDGPGRRAAFAAALLTLACGAVSAPAGAAIPKAPAAAVPHPLADGADAIVARAMTLAQAGDCKGVLALLDPMVAGEAGAGTPARFSAQMLRLPCLGSTRREDEVGAVLAELKAQAPTNPMVQGYQVLLDADTGRYAAAADGLGAIADQRSRALALMPGDLWRALAQQLTIAGDTQRRDRVSLALALADWEPPDRPELSEALAADGIGALLDKKAVEDARQLLPRVTRPGTLWEMAIQRRFAPLWSDIETRIGPQGGTVIDGYARTALDAYADTPRDAQATLDAARAFLFLGRYDDVAATAAATQVAPGMSEQQVNIIVTDADAMATAGHHDAALTRLRAFANADLSTTPEAASALIGLAEQLDDNGRYDEELAIAQSGAAQRSGYFSPYGAAWLQRNQVCALVGLKRVAEARAAADVVKTLARDNPAAAIEGLLCAGRDDEAAAIAIATLASPDGADRLADQFQPDSALLPHPPSHLRGLWARLLARPDVKAAFERVARILPKTYWPASTPRALPVPQGAQGSGVTTT